MKRILMIGALLLGSTSMMMSQCTTFSAGPYIDFNNAGGAPCLEEPVRTLTAFEAWASESYLMDGIEAGVTYTFDICTGPGAGTWSPDFTIIAPSGAIDASGNDGGSACTITFTASESGEYELGISEVGFCPGGTNTATDNGYPQVSYVSGPISSCAPPVTTCEAGNLVNNSAVTLATVTETTDVDATGVIVPNSPTIGGQGVLFQPLTGAGGGLGGEFILSGVSLPYVFDADLNGVLSGNGFPLLTGTYNVRPAVYADGANTFASICDTTFRARPVTFPAGSTLCEGGTVTSTDQNICPGDITNLDASGVSIPSGGDYVWFFFAQDTIANDDYAYILGGASYSGDLNADLVASALDPIAPGVYDIIGAVFDPILGDYCAISAGGFVYTVYDGADPACSACQAPTDLDVVELGFGTANARVNATWTNPEGTTNCEVRGGRISPATAGTANPAFANINNTQTITQTNGSTVLFNITLYNNPNVPFNVGSTYGYDVRCQCADLSGFSDWAMITPEATFVVPVPPPGVVVDSYPLGTVAKASMTANKSADRSIEDVRVNRIAAGQMMKFNRSTANAKALDAASLNLFPNPATDELSISVDASVAGNVDVKVVDMTGRTVLVEQIGAQKGMNLLTVNVANLQNGMYIIEVGTIKTTFVKK